MGMFLIFILFTPCGFLCVRAQEFSLHAETSCPSQPRQKLEQRCRDITRPALGHKRLSRTRADEVVLPLKTP